MKPHKTAEAVKKWCPMVRNLYISGANVTGVTSYNADRDHNKCIAVHCAMWVAVDEESGYCGLIQAVRNQ